MIQSTLAPKRVLVVANALRPLAPVIMSLREAGCWVELATTPTEAIGRAAVLNPELVVMEDQIADVNSVDLSMQIRSIVPQDRAPIFIMAMPHELQADATASDGKTSSESPFTQQHTAHSAVTDAHVAGRDLVNRIAGILGKLDAPATTKSETERITTQGICLDRVRHRAWVKDQPLHLTPTEFKLLWEFASRPGYVLSRVELTKVCKGSASAVQARTIDAHVKSIRRKLKDYAGLIETVHGVGYRFQDGEW